MYVFRLESGQGGGKGGVKVVGSGGSGSSSPTAGGGGSGRGWDGGSSPPDSVGGTTQGLNGRCDAFIEKKSASVSCIHFSFFLIIIIILDPCAFANLCWRFLALRYKESHGK